MPLPLLDANVIVRHVTGDESNHSPRSTAFIQRIERGEISVLLFDTVLFEAVYVLEGFYRYDRATIRDAVLPIIELPGIELAHKTAYRDHFDLYTRYPGLSYADSLHAALMRDQGITEIVSFDRGFDRLPGITRIEPPPLGE